jgi:PAS domain S-box-containing protein
VSTRPLTDRDKPEPLVRVLLVDDDPNDRALAGRHLRNAFSELEIEAAVNREELDEALGSRVFDLVITDYHLHWIDGLTVLRLAKRQMPDVPVIMFTGTGTEEVAVEAMKAGLDDYILKTEARAIRLVGAAQQAVKRARTHATMMEAERTANAAARLSLERSERLVESANDAIVSISQDGRITSWNSRAQDLFGWARDDVLGRTLTELVIPERWRVPHRQAIDKLVRAGLPVSLTRHSTGLAGLHKAGHEVPIEVSIAHEQIDDDWVFTGFMRDQASEAAAREELRSEVQRREQVAASLARIRPTGSPERIAGSICDEIAETLGLELVFVEEVVGRGRTAAIVPLAFHLEETHSVIPIDVGKPLPRPRGRQLLERARGGPWVSDLAVEERTPYLETWFAAGLRSAAYVPIGEPGDPMAILIVGSSHADVGRLARLLSDFLEYGAIAAAYLGQALADRRAIGQTRQVIQAVIRQSSFRPVFQPIIDLERNEPIGYEGLTRFADGRAPDLVFAEADAAGLGLELELATMARLVRAAERIPLGLQLSLNASPELILSGRLAAALPSWRERVILEVTEHVEISDYPAVRAAVEALGMVRLAVDDAGAGFASLRHIIELQPEYMKLDISLVRGIEDDPARQALVAGMVYFAVLTDRTLIAEGIETQEELDTLRMLGVDLGQGYLLGRPGPIDGF